MSEVRYSVNGKYFKDFGMYISDSDGLFDGLKRKKINTYDWAEYNGSAPDLSNPKFEAREITLKGFVVGDNWLQMKSNFDSIITEFQKAGTQRLLIEPLGLKALPFEVYLEDATPLNKTFKDRKMVGTFTLKLIEPNPIKKVLYLTGDALNLSYNSPNETEIFYGNGLKDVMKGHASLSGKGLANRVVSGYGFEGRNFYKKNTPIADVIDPAKIAYKDDSNEGIRNGFGLLNYGEYRIPNVINSNGYWTISFTVWGGVQSIILNPCDLVTDQSNVNVIGNITFISRTFLIENHSDLYNFIDIITYTSIPIYFINFKVEKGNKATPYTPAPEDEKHIIIAGNIDEITNLTTNATVLWEQL